jgi:hypothetical protein
VVISSRCMLLTVVLALGLRVYLRAHVVMMPGTAAARLKKPHFRSNAVPTAGTAATKRTFVAPSASSEPLDECVSAAEGLSQIEECFLPFNKYPIDVTDNKYIVDATRCPSTLITEADKRFTRFGPAETLEECLVEADGREAVASCLSDNSLA